MYILISILLTIFFTNAAQTNIVTSIPDIADMVQIIGGERVRVSSLASGREDLHGVPVRPSFLPMLNRADLLITLGLDAEHAWLPALVAESRNQRIAQKSSGWIEIHHGVEILDIPQRISRSEGEQHPRGNPHYNIGPQSGRVMANNIFKALVENDPDGYELFEKNLNTYLLELDELERYLLNNGEPLKGRGVVSYHADISYLASFYGMIQMGTLEPKPGIPPTASHLRDLSNTIRSEGVDIIIYNQSQSGRLPNRLGSDLGVSVVQIANAVGAQRSVQSWIDLQKHNLHMLLEAISE